jgi:hypothetical protein
VLLLLLRRRPPPPQPLLLLPLRMLKLPLLPSLMKMSPGTELPIHRFLDPLMSARLAEPYYDL